MSEELEGKGGGRPVRLDDEEGVTDIVADTVLSLWQIVNNLTRLRPSKKDRYRVTIFGSARAKPGSKMYDEVKQLAASLSDLGCDIITGGGPGLMAAANEGAAQADLQGKTKSVGIRVDLPFEQENNPFVEQMFEHGTFFTRLHHFVIASDAFVVTPGGIGTVLETIMVWQLLQVRHLHDTPLILIGDMWPGMLQWAEESMLPFDPPLADPKDLEIPDCVKDADAAIALIRDHHQKWIQEQTDA
ncbi:MAG: LOG family protein [Rubripirellula sp.]